MWTPCEITFLLFSPSNKTHQGKCKRRGVVDPPPSPISLTIFPGSCSMHFSHYPNYEMKKKRGGREREREQHITHHLQDHPPTSYSQLRCPRNTPTYPASSISLPTRSDKTRTSVPDPNPIKKWYMHCSKRQRHEYFGMYYLCIGLYLFIAKMDFIRTSFYQHMYHVTCIIDFVL